MNSFDKLKADLVSHHIEGIAREGHTPFACDLISQVDGNLWQGGVHDGVQVPFHHIVSLYVGERFTYASDLKTLVVCARLQDGPVVPDVTQLYALADWVNVCRALGPTLVHCQAGLNRSGLVTALSLIRSGMTPPAAIKLLREKRSPAVLCNKTFERWLLGEHPTQLSTVELDVLLMLSQGYGYKQIAAKLGCATGTLKVRMAKVYERMGADGQVHAVALAFRRGWLK